LRNTVILLALALLAAVTWFASVERIGPSLGAGVEVESRPLGYYLRGARIVGTDEQGRIAYRISARQLDEVPNEERLRLEGVSVEYLPAEETAWSISAASASAPKDRSLLELVGDVVLRSAPADGATPLLITTQQLRFSPDTSSVESDEQVTIEVGDWQLTADSLRTHLKGDTLELESVHGIFAAR
jgi:LPS export ABC transporter protein LptC